MSSILESQNLIGAVGEMIACRHIPYAFRVRSHAPDILKFKEISNKARDFLVNNWLHFDIISINKNEITLYEVKTRKRFMHKLRPLYRLEKITKPSYDAYMKARRLGITSKLAIVRLKKDWCYSITIKDFEDVKFWVDKRNKPYSGRRY
ncbi:hypothetical protein KY330_05450 [Candidatus Woesearchaeota archaeon]|nr:hypothetical protein [Candidatus Woesearchaeota archaeon]